MVGELVADRAYDLLAKQVGVVAEVAAQRVAVDDDAVGHVVWPRRRGRGRRRGAAYAVGDHDGDVVVLDQAAQQIGQLVERVAHRLLEVVVVVGVEVHELGLVGLGVQPFAGQALAAR